MLTDPIADMVASIKNANLARHKTVEVPYSRVKQQIADILVHAKYLVAAEMVGQLTAEKKLKLTLRYQQKDPTIHDLKRVSKPGLRIYRPAKRLKSILPRGGVTIISTSQGIMTIKEAKTQNLGGEIICEVW